MGGVSSRDHPITTAEDRRAGAYHRAKDLDPLYQGLPLEEGLRLGLGSSTLLKNPPSQKLHPLSRNRRLLCVSSIPARQFQAGCPIEKPIPKIKTKKNEPTRRQIYNRTTPREKGGLAANFPDVFALSLVSARSGLLLVYL
jgi:hypothetical protein